MAGVEAIPDLEELNDVRCWYLIEHVSTGVLKKGFDNIVGKDFWSYLKSNPKYRKKLQKLIDRRIIKEDQQSKLPPLNRKPNSSEFDITLLACLLKNVCGLKPHDHPEWKNTSGISFESYITQLRICRNEFVHQGTSTSDAAALWTKITRILHGLNKTVRISDIQKQIDKAAETVIDENQRKQYYETVSILMKIDDAIYEKIQAEIKTYLSKEQKINKEIDEIKAQIQKYSKNVDDEQLRMMTSGCDKNITKEKKPRSHKLSEENDQCHSRTDTDKILCQCICLFDLSIEILRACFEKITGKDFWNFLQNKPELKRKLKVLVETKKISDTQTQYLPLESETTATDNLDFGTLYCLFMFVCGLQEPDDSVWTEPSESNMSVAANITRLRQFSHKLRPCYIELLTQEDLDELTLILQRLNGDGQIPDLGLKINYAKQRTSDEELKKIYFEHEIVWCNMDRLFDHGFDELRIHVERIFSALEKKAAYSNVLSRLKNRHDRDSTQATDSYNEQQRKDSWQSHQPVQQPHTDIERDLKNRLLMQYKDAKMQTFPGEFVDMSEIFEWPTVIQIEGTKTQKIMSYEPLLNRASESKRDILVFGETGSGKSSFFQRLSLLWSMTQPGEKCNEGMEKDQTCLAKFDYIFHISPLELDSPIDIIDCIIQQYYYTESENKLGRLRVSLQHIIDTKKCLIILDGFDATHETSNASFQKIKSEKCMYITCTSEDIGQLQTKGDEHIIHITGLHDESLRKYVHYLVKKQNRNPDDFMTDVYKYGRHVEVCTPRSTPRLVLLWTERGFKDKSNEKIPSRHTTSTMDSPYRYNKAGSQIGCLYGPHMGSATECHVGPIWAANICTIWDPCGFYMDTPYELVLR